MRQRILCFALFLWAGHLGLSQIPEAQTPKQLFKVSGTVVNGMTGQSIERARLTIRLSGKELGAAVTGANGHFQFFVGKGKYLLSSECDGLRTQTYDAHLPLPGFGTGVVVGSGQNTDNLVFRMFPFSAVSGKILDQSGDPVEGALVQLLRSRASGGRKRTITAGWAYTNDLGEYRFGRLSFGTYYLAVTAKPWYSYNGIAVLARTLHVPVSGAINTAYVPVYYPNTPDIRSAAPLMLNPGQELEAPFTLIEGSGYNLAVHLEGNAPRQSRLDLSTDGVEGADSFQRVVPLYGAAGNVPAVPPGHYKVRVVGVGATSPAVGIGAVDIVSADAELEVTMSPPRVISGTVLEEGADPKTVSRLIISLRDESNNTVSTRNPNSDGSFAVPVLPGTYRVSVSGPGGFFARQVFNGGQEITGGTFDFDPNSQPKLKIVASNGVGRVKGFVYDRGKPVSGALVALTSAHESADAYHNAYQTDSDGSFDFQTVRPGEYHLFTFDSIDFEYANPAAVLPYLKTAKNVTVQAYGSYSEDLELTEHQVAGPLTPKPAAPTERRGPPADR